MLRMFLSFSSSCSSSLLLPFPIPDLVVLSDLEEQIANGPRCMWPFPHFSFCRYIYTPDILYLSCAHLLIIGMLRDCDSWMVHSVLEELLYTWPVMIRITADPVEVTENDKDVYHKLWRCFKGLNLGDILWLKLSNSFSNCTKSIIFTVVFICFVEIVGMPLDRPRWALSSSFPLFFFTFSLSLRWLDIVRHSLLVLEIFAWLAELLSICLSCRTLARGVWVTLFVMLN